ncbi:TonB-dependent siderophore receptor [Shimwellia pseudoproteus]|uniref:TonB-dependent siderophore receptor n=1 Tax=Shimwellia pseudoproteus TaxID=570012 RepID=UPI0018ED7BF0|nr:TonB-dependent siderophore receptor [Shimwellia pseudoproteus]
MQLYFGVYGKSPFIRHFLATACGCSFIVSGASHAAGSGNDIIVTANGQHPHSYSAPESTTSSKTPVSRLEDAQSLSVVTQQQMQDYQSSNLTDAMRFVSGVAQTNTLAGTEDGLVRRGFGSNSDGSIFRDGIRSSQGMNLDATTERVEVLKGSASLLYGILNPGGMINVISKKPQYQWSRAVSGHYSGTGGGAGGIDITGPLGNGFAFRLIAERQDQHYWRDFGHDLHTLISPSLQWYGDKASFYIGYEYFKYDIPYDRGTAFINGKPVNIGYKTRLDDYANHAWGHTQALNSHWDYQFSDTWSTRITLGYNQRQYSNNEVRVAAVNPKTGAVTRSADANRGFNHQTKYIAWDVTGTPVILGMTHHLVAGADDEINQTYRDRAYNGKKNSAFTLSDPVYGLRPITDSSTEKLAARHLLNRIHNHSLYVKDSIDLTDRWIAVAGARYQHYAQRKSQGSPSIVSYDDSGNKFLPQTGLIYKLTRDLSLYGTLSKSFTPSTTVADDGSVGKPEQGTTYEIGSKWQVTPSLFATLALYNIDEHDISLSLNGSTYAVDRARSRGVEVEVNGEILPGWDVSANYSYDEAKITRDSTNPDNNGNRLQNAPRHSGALYLSHDLTISPLPGAWRIGGGARYIGTRAGDPNNSFTLPDYVVADSFIAWNNRLWGKQTHLQLNLNNLFNKHYYTSSGGNLRVAEGQSRNLVLSASVRF